MDKYKKAVLTVSKLLLNDKTKKQEIEDLIKKYENNKINNDSGINVFHNKSFK